MNLHRVTLIEDQKSVLPITEPLSSGFRSALQNPFPLWIASRRCHTSSSAARKNKNTPGDFTATFSPRALGVSAYF